MSTPGQDEPGHLGLTESELRAAYTRLSSIREAVVPRILDEDQWVRSNILLDEGLGANEVANRVGVTEYAILQVTSPRRCLAIHNGDTEALRRCLEGEASAEPGSPADA
jgi:hypothetical protein